MLLQCSPNEVRLIEAYRAKPHDQQAPRDPHAQCCKWSQLLQDHRLQNGRGHGAREPDHTIVDNLLFLYTTVWRLIGKDPDAGKDWGQEEKRTTEGEMVGWHHRLCGHKSEQAPGDGEGQGSQACCSPWGCKELDMTEWLNNNDLCVYLSISIYQTICRLRQSKYNKMLVISDSKSRLGKLYLWKGSQ